MATPLVPVSCEKPYPHLQPFKSGLEGVARNTHGSHTVLTRPIRLVGVDDLCLR